MNLRALALLLLSAAAALAQDHTTDAAYHRSRRLLSEAQLPSPAEVRVYDFVNYHRHELPAASLEEPVAFDGRLLRTDLAPGGTHAFLQLGIATWRPEAHELGPLHLAVVVDTSGSMAADDKIGFVKKGLAALAEVLDEDDLLTIVTFANEATVVRAAAPVTNRRSLLDLIEGIRVGGGTNLHAGLVAGLDDVAAHLEPGRMAKVLLLSDGQANQGVTDLEAIVGAARERTKEGIGLSTIGIGLDFNDRLMCQLAESAKGTYHFLDSPRGIERTFVQEVHALLGTVGKSPRVSLELAEGVELYRVHGYAFREAGSTIEFGELLDLPAALTQVIPLELAVGEGFDPARGPLARATLEYVDVRTGSQVRRSVEVTASRRAPGEPEGPSDPAVRKNRTIARLAEGFLAACRHAHDESVPAARRRDLALDALAEALSEVETSHGPDARSDPDLARILELLEEARRALGGPER